MIETTITATADDNKIRLDFFVARALGTTRSQAQKLLRAGRVWVNGTEAKPGYSISPGDRVDIMAVLISGTTAGGDGEKQEILDIPIVTETDTYVVIDKPAGVLVHPTDANESGTVADWIRERYPAIVDIGSHPSRPGIVHRLDREASGLLVIAKTPQTFDHLKQQFQQRTVDKYYTVLVHGEMEKDNDVIDFPIDRGPDGRMVSRPRVAEVTLENVGKLQHGKSSLTEFWVEERYVNYTLLRVKIHTGRTHQIRVHFFAYNHPVVGDILYRQKRFRELKKQLLPRLFLHATDLSFDTIDGERVTYHAPLPDILHTYLAALRRR